MRCHSPHPFLYPMLTLPLPTLAVLLLTTVKSVVDVVVSTLDWSCTLKRIELSRVALSGCEVE